MEKTLKLNFKRTMVIGFAFFGILLLWQVYDSWCPTFLTELFGKAMYGEAAWLAVRDINNAKEVLNVQYLVGIMMAIDNLAALILLPIFGHLSDKTNTKIVPIVTTACLNTPLLKPTTPHIKISIITIISIILIKTSFHIIIITYLNNLCTKYFIILQKQHSMIK